MQTAALLGRQAEEVTITGGTGTGSTELTAFDAALYGAGLHDANLIAISSIVPAGATVSEPQDPATVAESVEPGAYVPAVYACGASDVTGDTVHAAIAGARLASGYGVNVEYHGRNEDPGDVRAHCDRMIAEMANNRDASVTDEAWFRCETAEVTDDGWTAAVAAMAYTSVTNADNP